VDFPFQYFYIAIAACTVGGPALYRAILTRRFKTYEEAGRAALRARELGRAEELLTNALRLAGGNRCLRGARIACMHNLSLVLFRRGKFEEAAGRMEEVVRQCSSQQPHSKLLPRALNLLAQIYWALYVVALTNLEKAVELERQSDGDPEKASTFARNNRGALHQWSGEFEEAEQIWKEVLAIREKLAGEGGDRAAQVRSNLGWLRCLEKRYEEAEKDQHRSYAFHTLAILCTATLRLDEADQLFARVIELRIGVMVPDHPDLLRLQGDIAVLRMAQGRIADADELLTTARTLLEAKLGAQHPYVAAILYRLGLLRARQARAAEAKDLLEAALAIQTRLAPAHPETEDCRKALEELEP
jgi:tetratricopeptide (TPR) repeat protein